MIKKGLLLLVILTTLASCGGQEKTTVFSEKALADTFIDQQGNTITFANIIKQYKGKNVLIDVWASWCGDCVKGMPKVKALQNKHPETVFLFLSLDKKLTDWEKGIEKYNVTGEHYYMQSGWKGDFGTFLNLDWIPRYLVVDKDGNIKVFKAITADDKNITENLN